MSEWRHARDVMSLTFFGKCEYNGAIQTDKEKQSFDLTKKTKCAKVDLSTKGERMNTVHDSIAKPKTKTRDGWNTKAGIYKTTRGQKLKGSYYQRATAPVSRWVEPTR